jgi:hypothetical protein
MFERFRGGREQAKRPTRHGRTNQGWHGRGGRRLTMESLENRSMLSASANFLSNELFGLQGLFAGQASTGTVASQFVVAMPQNVPNGTPVTVLIKAEDAQNDFVPGYSGTASITSSDSAATFPSTVTFHHGFATLQVTFATPGSQSLTATDSSSAPSIAGSASTTVATPDVATQYAVILPTAVPNGVPVKVYVEALDAEGHLVQSYSGMAAVSSTDASAKLTVAGTNEALPADITFQHGFASFTVTFATSGAQSLTLTDTSNAKLTSTVNTTVAVADVATQYAITLPSTVANDAPVSVKVKALDAEGNVVRSYSGTATVKSTDTATGASVPATVTFHNGVANFEATFVTPGSQMLTVTDQTTMSLTGSATTVVAAPDVATHFAILLPQNVAAGKTLTVEIVALDAQNDIVQNYAGTAAVIVTDKAATVSPTPVTFQHGIASVQVTFATVGSQSLTVTDTTTSTLTSTVTTNVKVKSGGGSGLGGLFGGFGGFGF